MKKKFIYLLSIFFYFAFHHLSLMAQNCDYMRKYKKGTKFQMISYDRKGRPLPHDTTQFSEIIDKVPTADGWELQYGANVADKYGNVEKKIVFRTYCKNGEYILDTRQTMQSNLNTVQEDSTQNNNDPLKGSVTITGEPCRYVNVEVGNNQPDALLEMTSSIGKATLIKVKSRSFNRKVVGIETITTPAGTFECYKITFDWETKIFFTRTGNSIEYWNRDYGQVKVTSYNSKGKVLYSTELSKFIE
jgi:hypothetical protein